MFECVREPDAECKELSVSLLYSRRIEKCSYVSITRDVAVSKQDESDQTAAKKCPVSRVAIDLYFPSFLTSQLKLQVIPLSIIHKTVTNFFFVTCYKFFCHTLFSL
jgi:hypothetical protein